MDQCLDISLSDEPVGGHSHPFVQDVIVPAWGYLSCLLWVLGYPEQSQAAGRKSIDIAREIGQPHRLAFALYSNLHRDGLFEADAEGALALADEIVGFGEEEGVQLYPTWARFYQGVAKARQSDPKLGIAIMRQVQLALLHHKVRLFAPIHAYHLAAAHARCAEHQLALGLLDDAIQAVEATGERSYEAELHRLRGILLLEVGQVDAGTAALTAALAVARRQRARLWELRAAVALARHLHGTRGTAVARDVLVPICDWFTEGFDSADLKAAKALLVALQ